MGEQVKLLLDSRIALASVNASGRLGRVRRVPLTP
jgi:hypothetical protein